jgi:DNA-binding SARP family transcriptional activator
MSAYQVYLFGAPRLEYQQQPVPIDTRKALALLAYLLLNGEPQSRDTLAALLWPESDQKSARAALRRTLSALRAALNEEIVDFGREIITIHPGRELWCDVMAFQSRLDEIHQHGHPVEQVCGRCLIPLQEAAELYKADFMAGFSLRDSAAFDDWQFFEADRLRRKLASVLERLVAIHGDQGDFQPALEVARRWLTLDLLNEAAHRALIMLYAQNGQRNAALRQYRECVRILDQELGVPPLDETTHLYEAVKENRFEKMGIRDYLSGGSSQPTLVSDQPPLVREQPPLITDLYPLVGRAPEWEELTRLYGGIRQDGVFAALTGEIGIGKSRLAQDFITHQQGRGAIALSARCYAGESNLAYTPLIDLLRQGINQAEGQNWWQGLNPHWLSEITLLIPEISESLPELPALLPANGFGAQNRFYEGVCQILIALVGGTLPGIIFIDNLEWVDQSTLDLLAYLARRMKGRPIFLFVTWQTETSPTTEILDQILNDAVWQGYGIHLPLSALQPSQAHELIDRIAPDDQQISPVFKNRLAKVSEGLPYMLVEYLQAALKGEISTELVPGDHWPVPTSLRGLLQNRLAGLSGSALQILQAAAVIGRTFNFDLLQTASGRAEEEIIQGIEELLAHNLILEELDQTAIDLSTAHYDFKHEQMRDLILEKVSLIRRRLLHRRIAEALEGQERFKSLRSQSGQIAYHYQQAGFPEKAAEYYFQAGLQDCNIHANADALSHYQAALALGYPKKPDVLVELGDLYTLKGDYPQAIQHYEAAAAFDVPDLLPVIEQKIGQIYLRRGQWEQAASHFEAALFDLAAYPAEQRKAFQSRVYANLSLAFHHRGQTERAASLADKALTIAKEGDDSLALAQAHNLLGILARSDHQFEQAVQHLEQSLSFARQLDNPQAQIAALNNLALAQTDLRNLEVAIETIRQAIDESLILGDRHLEAALRSNHADMLREAGRTEEAMQQLKQAASIFAEIGQSAEDWEPEIWKLVEW